MRNESDTYQTLVMLCDCNEPEHQVVFNYYDDEPDELYIRVSLIDNLPFWKRLWTGIRYIMGYRYRNNWHFAETLLDARRVGKLKAFLEQFEADRDTYLDVRENGGTYTPRRKFSAP